MEVWFCEESNQLYWVIPSETHVGVNLGDVDKGERTVQGMGTWEEVTSGLPKYWGRLPRRSLSRPKYSAMRTEWMGELWSVLWTRYLQLHRLGTKGISVITRSVGILGARTVSLAAVANRKGEESPDDGPKRTIKSMKTETNDSSSKGADPRKSLVWPGSGDPSKQAILQN